MTQKRKVMTGQRDLRIELVSFSTAKTSINEDRTTEVSLGFFYSKREDTGGRESEDGKVRHIYTRSYVIPYVPGIKQQATKLKVKEVDSTDVLDVYHVEEIGRKEQLMLHAKEHE